MTDYFSYTTVVDDLLKNVYGPGVKNQFEEAPITWNLFPKSTTPPKGKNFVGAIKYSNAGGSGARKENERLPNAVASSNDNFTVSPKLNYRAIRFSGLVMKVGDGGEASFEDVFNSEMQTNYKGLEADINRQCHGDGFGALCTLSQQSDALVTSGSTTCTVTCDNDLGVHYIKRGMILDFYSGANIDQSSVASHVVSVDRQSKTFELGANDGSHKATHPNSTAAAYTITTDPIPSGAVAVLYGTRELSHSSSDTSREIVGLQGIFDDGTSLSSFEGISESSNPEWKALVLDNSGTARPLTIPLLLNAVDGGYKNSGTRPTKMLMGIEQKTAYAELLIADKRYMDSKLAGGYERISFSADGSIEMIIDSECHPAYIYIFPEGCIQRFEIDPGIEWLMGMNGENLLRRDDYDQYDCILRHVGNLGTDQRNALVLLKDLSVTNVYA